MKKQTPNKPARQSLNRSSPAPIMVNEDYKIRIAKLVDDFRANLDLSELPLNELNNHERRYIHELAKKFGLKTKSKGTEPNRVLTISKPSLQVQQPTTPLVLSAHVKQQLSQYFTKQPITPEETQLQLNIKHQTVHYKKKPKPLRSSSTQEFTPSAAAMVAPAVIPSRTQLPVWAHREEILNSISTNQITIVSGETGSGKSTQLVQYLLDSLPTSRIVCTQPRRLPCISLATRVVEERGTLPLGSEVGYAVRFDTKYSETKTRLLFCTTGVALVKLQTISASNNNNSTLFENITHVVLDEIHDRDANSDFLLVFCREMLVQRNIKVVLMSATLKVDSFLTYFSDFTCGNVQVEGRSFPVDAYFLEDVLRFTRGGALHSALHHHHHDEPEEEEQQQEEARLECPTCKRIDFDSVETYAVHLVHCSSTEEEINPWEDEDTTQVISVTPPAMQQQPVSTQMMVEEYLLARDDETEVDLDLIVSLVETIAVNVENTSVLIFLPGWYEISALVDMLESNPELTSRFTVLPLHSAISPKDQWRVFDSRIKNKIICSTNIAETSLTIPDVEYVIDSCLAKEKGYDPQIKSSSLQSCFISKSSAMQRRGRAGRCFQGTCFHLVSRQRFASFLDSQIPEILRTPLEQICLQARAIVSTEDFPSIRDFLSRAMDAPNPQTVLDALHTLTAMGCITPHREMLTQLGRTLSTLPMDPKLGKMLLLGSFLECLDPALTLAVTSGFRDPFLLEPGGGKNRGKVFLSKSIASLGISDHAAVLSSVRGYEREKHSYCTRFALSSNVLDSITQMKRQVKQQLGDRYASSMPQRENIGVVQALICAGTVPNLALFRSDRFFSGKHARIRLHASSCAREEENAWYVFEEMVRNNRGSCLRMVTSIDPLTMILFAGNLGFVDSAVKEEEEEEEENDTFRVLEDGTICINAWARVQCESNELAMQLAVLRLRLETSFLQAVERGNGGFCDEDRAVARFVSKLLAPAPAAGALRPAARAFVPQKKV